MTPKALARTAGLLYLAVAVFTIFAGLVAESVAGADDVRASAGLLRLGFASELVGAVAFLLTSMALHRLLRHVAPMVAAAMVVFVAVAVAIQTLNLLNQQTALTIATDPAFADALGRAGSDRLVALFAGMHQDGYLIAQTYFGLWLLPLAYLVVRSDYFPAALGYLLAVGCCGHLVDVFTRFLAPGAGAAVSPFAMVPAAIAELTFLGWLLVKGVADRERTAAPV